MTGRGIDQILTHPNSPQLFEPYVHDAGDYVTMAERAHGAIPRRVAPDYVWGDALATRRAFSPDATIVNLETSVTSSDAAWPGKEIHYRMHPQSVGVLNAFGIDCCVAANNHVLDWGRAGLMETVHTLRSAGIACVGAGANDLEAGQCAVLADAAGGRILVWAFAHGSSGVPPDWAAGADTPGVNALPDLSPARVARIRDMVMREKGPRDVAVCSIHWGGNWGYDIPDEQRAFAHALVDSGGVDIVFGHSSHHAKGVERYHGKLILYGCGDFLNDYEGIPGHATHRADLAMMYLVELRPESGRLEALTIVPFEVRQFRLRKATSHDGDWLTQVLNREGSRLNTKFHHRSDGTIQLLEAHAQPEPRHPDSIEARP
jgi:poly-gamma-glutamate synthesis protein (capsule biosynthesis protein)